MYYYHKSLCKKIEKEKIKSWFIFLAFSTLLLSCESTEESNLHKPLIYLNHVYLTIDSTTYSYVGISEFLQKEFALIQTKTIQADSNESWTGTYIFGKNTYIEFFNSGKEENQGLFGIGFGVEVIGGIDSLYQSITDSGKEHIEKGVRHLRTETGEIPWFYFLNSIKEDSGSLLSTWVMEYDVEYMKYKYPDIDPEKISITRELYNHKSYENNLLLKDIIEIELALKEFDHNKLKEELKLYEHQIEQEGEMIIVNGPDIKIILRAKLENKSGICRIKFSLTDKKYEQQTVLFGNKSKLILNTDRTAEWHFSI